jgi:hypothetical protein
MDNKTIILYEKDFKVKKLGVILFDAGTLSKIGEYVVNRIDASISFYQPVYNYEFQGIEYNKQIDAFAGGKYLMVSMVEEKAS